MPFEPIPLDDGNSIIPIAFGTGTALFGKDATDYVLQAFKAGFRHIDTAQVYRNEESVGAAIEASGLPREDIYITTKYGGGDDVRTEFNRSLKKLNVPYVDLYLVHFPKFVAGKEEQSWRAIEQIHSEGLAKSIGVSNYTVSDLKKHLKFAKIKPVVNQVNFHPNNWKANKPLLEYANNHGIVLEAYSSLTPITKEPGKPVDKVVNKIASRLNVTPAQVIFSWVKAKGVVIVTTSSKEERLKEYLEVGDIAPLSREDVEAIDDAGLRS